MLSYKVSRSSTLKIKVSIIFCIYTLGLLYFSIKMFYYASEIGGMPDETAHVGYIVYLETSKEMIPDFKSMPAYSVEEEQGNYIYKSIENTYNYLGHPPLYYQIMRVANAITVKEDGSAIVNILLLRKWNIFFTLVSISIIWSSGYKRIAKITDKILPHLINVSVVVTLPMLAYVGAGVSNDNLVLFGVVLFFIGIVRYYEENINLKTYLLVGSGFAIACLSKLTMAEILGIALIIILVGEIVRTKSINILKNRNFYMTVWCYIIPVIYIFYTYLRYGSIHPGLSVIDRNYFETTVFYVPVLERTIFTWSEYIQYFWGKFWNSWATIYGNIDSVTIDMAKSKEIVSTLPYYIPIILSLVYAIKCIHKKDSIVYLSIWIGILVTFFTQMFRAYVRYWDNGYLGSFQSRYYLALVPFFALSSAFLLIEENSAKLKKRIYFGKYIICIIFILLLFYGDFWYFLTHIDFTKLK